MLKIFLQLLVFTLAIWNCEQRTSTNKNEDLFLILRSNRGKFFTSSKRTFPTLLPIMRQAIPKSLKTKVTTSNLSKNFTQNQVANELATIFKDTYTDGSTGTTEEGFLATKIAALDFRIQEAADNLSNPCFSSTTSNYKVKDTDLGLLDSNLQISLDLQCKRKMSDYSGWYGIQENKASAFVRLENSSENVNFFLLGNIYDYGKETETAEFFQFDYSAAYNYYILSKAIGKSKKNEFEFVGVATQPNVFSNPAGSNLDKRFGCGFRFISNGTVIKVEANIPNSSSLGACTNSSAVVVNACLNANDNSLLPISECSNLQFTLTNQILKAENLPPQTPNMLNKFQESNLPSGLGSF